MENNIKLTADWNNNAYLRHFQIAQFNFNLVIQEEPRIRRKFRRKNLSNKTA
jgi:hypothetical protein